MTAPLKTWNFRILFAGRVVDALGNAVSPAALTLAVVTATRSSAALAVILVCGMLPRVALLPVGGVIADRMGARRVALVSDAVAGLAQLSIGLVLLSGHLSIAPVAVASAVAGAASAFGVPAALPLVSGTVDADGRLAANSLLGVASSATSIVGPAIAGVLIFTVGAGWAFVLDAATFAVSAGTLAVIRFRPPESGREPGPGSLRQSLGRELAVGWEQVRARSWYWASIIGHGTCNFALGLLLTAGPLIAITELGGKTVWLAALEASAAGYLAGAVAAARTRVSRGVLAVNLGLTIFAVPMVLFALPAPAWADVTAYGIAALGLGFANPVWLTTVQQEVPAGLLARVTAYDWLVSLGAQLLGYAAAPLLVQAPGRTWPLAIVAVLVVIALVIPSSLPSVRSLRLRRA